MAATTSTTPLGGVRALLKNPIIAAVLIVVYIFVAAVVLLNLDRRDLWFPLHTTLAFPPLVIAPWLILGSSTNRWFKGASLLILLLVVMPIIGIYDSTYLELLIQISIFAAMALGLNIVVGFAGLLDLGYIAFFAVGAYVWGMFTSSANTVFNINGMLVPGQAFYIFIFIGVIASGIAGILLGLPVLRLRGDYLAIVTLGFGEIIRVLANNLDQPINFTNGSQGLHGVARPSAEFLIEPVRSIASWFNISLATPAPVAQQLLFYFFAIVIIGVIILLASRLDNSPIGRAWTAIREDEVAAIAMGVPLVRMKLLAFSTGAACAGAVGVLYGAKQTFVSPESFQLIQSINILAMVIVGGMGGIRGVALGAVIVTLLNLQVLSNFSLLVNNLRNIDYVIPIINFRIADWPTQLTPDKYQRFIFGIMLVAMMIFRPEGLLPEPRRQLELHRESEDVGVTPEAEARVNEVK